MFEVIVGTILAFVGTGLIGVAGWLVALSNKVAVLDADRINLRQNIMDIINLKFDDLARRLERIERKLDHNESGE